MNEPDKLRVLLPHWIDHNEEHKAEFQRWINKAGNAAQDIKIAADYLTRVNKVLESALEKLGGPLPHTHQENYQQDAQSWR